MSNDDYNTILGLNVFRTYGFISGFPEGGRSEYGGFFEAPAVSFLIDRPRGSIHHRTYEMARLFSGTLLVRGAKHINSCVIKYCF